MLGLSLPKKSVTGDFFDDEGSRIDNSSSNVHHQTFIGSVNFQPSTAFSH
jgi:hypothetical protein